MPKHYHVPVLLYHRVINDSCAYGKSKIYVSEKKFRRQMEWLRQNNYQTTTLRELAAAKNDEELHKKIVLTFDDGYLDNYTILFPILKEYGFKAVIFLVTGYNRNEWSITHGEPVIELMNRQQIKEMESHGIEFGGHSHHHIDLRKATEEEQCREIGDCFATLQQICGKKPFSFSYPYGSYNAVTPKLAQEAGFGLGVTTIFGPTEWVDNFRIRRIEVRPHTGLLNFMRKASGFYFQTNWPGFLFSKLLGNFA